VVRTPCALAIALIAALGAAASDIPADDELSIALAGVVDSAEFPRDAATLERVPYRMLLKQAAVAPDERTLVNASGMFTYGGLQRSPDVYRGRIVFATGIVAQIERTTAPGIGRTDRNEVHTGVLAVLGRRRIRLWAFHVVRRPGDAILYVGDRVHLSGYFFKNTPMTDKAGDTRWLPLVVAPWPTYYGKWLPAVIVNKQAGGLLPLRAVEGNRVIRRPVIDFHADGGVSLNGVRTAAHDAIAAVKAFAVRNPRAAVVARSPDDAAAEGARESLAAAEVRVSWKELPPAQPAGLTGAR
jgi:hypothetical protein